MKVLLSPTYQRVNDRLIIFHFLKTKKTLSHTYWQKNCSLNATLQFPFLIEAYFSFVETFDEAFSSSTCHVSMQSTVPSIGDQSHPDSKTVGAFWVKTSANLECKSRILYARILVGTLQTDIGLPNKTQFYELKHAEIDSSTLSCASFRPADGIVTKINRRDVFAAVASC